MRKFSSSSLCNDKDAMLRGISKELSSSSLCNDKDAMLGWMREDVFKFFFMEWQGCNIKMSKWGIFQVLLYAMTRMQC